MRTIRQKKLINIGILVIIVGSLTIGFATFSSNLNIKSSTNVKPSPDNFKLVVSASATDPNVTTIVPKPHGNNNSTGTPATISQNGTTITISNINAILIKPGDALKYEFYVTNKGKYIAYPIVRNASVKVVCTALEGTTQALVDQACQDLSVDVFNYSQESHSYRWFASENPPLNIDSTEQLAIFIRYNSKTNQVLADGPFTANLGDINVIYSTVAL